MSLPALRVKQVIAIGCHLTLVTFVVVNGFEPARLSIYYAITSVVVAAQIAALLC